MTSLRFVCCLAALPMALNFGCGSSSKGHAKSTADGADGGEDGDAGSGVGGGGGSSGSGKGGRPANGGRPGTGGRNVSGPIELTLIPNATTIVVGASFMFQCRVTGTTDTACTFSLEEGASAGSVDDKGLYQAPGTPGEFHLTAVSHADATKKATAVIKVVEPTPGEWLNVTPAGVSLDPGFGKFPGDNFGFLDVVADPARPSDFYAFVCYQGVYRSTDFGLTWEKANTGQGGDFFDNGKPWSAAIDPNPNRDPETPPALYAAIGGVEGVFKSVDFGKSWTQHLAPPDPGNSEAQGFYSLEIDPYDSNHIITGMHQQPNLLESFDGGETWTRIQAAVGSSAYPFFIDTGDPETTRNTWLIMSQSGGGTGTVRTTDGAQSLTSVERLEHQHGSAQIFQAGGGVIYIAGLDGSEGSGVYRSTDYGVKWTKVASGNQNTMFGTASYVYSTNSAALNNIAVDPLILRSPRGDGITFETQPSPAGMTNGAKRAAVSYDGSHYVIVSGTWNAGLWRYLE